MNKAEKIKAEIERLINKYNEILSKVDKNSEDWVDSESMLAAKRDSLICILSFINSLEEPVSEDLEEAAKNYEEDAIFYAARRISDFFKAGAQWQKQQDQSTIELAEDHAYLAGQEHIIDRACEFLRSHIDKQLVIYHEFTWRSRDEFIEGFKKAMEE